MAGSLPPERAGLTKKFRLAYTHKDGRPDTLGMWFTANVNDAGELSEVFITVDKVGSLVRGVLNTLAIMISIALQSGVPPEKIIEKLRHQRFPPDGYTGDADVRSCSSIVDLLAQWLEKRFLPPKPEEKT